MTVVTPPFAETPLRLRLMRAAALTPAIKLFEFAAVDRPALPAFTAGAHIDIVTGAGLTRSYSLVNDEGETARYVIGVLRQGDGSAWLHDRLREGDVVAASLPRNGFALDETATDHLLIAGGIGITPILPMVRRLQAAGAAYRLVYCTRDRESTAFLDRVGTLPGARVTVHHDHGDPGRHLDLRGLLATRGPGRHAYVCGPRGLIDGVRAATRHWPAEAVHFELFASRPAAPAPAPAPALAPESAGDDAFEILLARSNRRFIVPADRSILEVLLANGVKAPYVCKEGWCGNCRTGLIGGKADHRDSFLDDEEQAANTEIQICVSRAAPGECLVLDR